MEAFAAAPAASVFSGSRHHLMTCCHAPPHHQRGRAGTARPCAADAHLPSLDKWAMMEHEFGRFLGEDPKLTLAKILLKKSDPDASSLDAEKLVASKKDRLDVISKEFMNVNKQDKASTTEEAICKPVKDKQPLGVSRPALSKPKLDEASLSLVRPVGSKPKQVEPPLMLLRTAGSKRKLNKPSLTLMPPMGSKPKVHAKLVQDSWPCKESLAAGTESSDVASISKEDNVDVTLRKPTVHQSEDNEPELKMKPNVNLKMMKDIDHLSNISLLKRQRSQKILLVHLSRLAQPDLPLDRIPINLRQVAEA